MTLPLRPNKGGFLRPFGCGWFIREFLLGHGPEGSLKIDPDKGATQGDINFQYKSALVRAIARDHSERIISDMVERGIDVTSEIADRIYEDELKKIPHKYTRMRYHSFLVYFGMLKRLGWVELTGETEPSAIQDDYPPAPSRVYYRLTDAGWKATMLEISDPVMTPYHYSREQRSAKILFYI
jgi:hypothetical protein